MDAKLTLKLDKDIIHRAKLYAREKNSSLSSLVENYFIFLTDRNEVKVTEITPLVKELSGIIKVDENFNLKEEYGKHLMEKYLK